MIKLAAQLVPLKVNAEKEGKDLAKKYDVHGFPTILFLTAEGDIVWRISGYLPATAFASEMTKIIDLGKRLPEIQKTLKTRPDDGEANAWMAVIWGARGKLEDAEAAIKKAEKAGYSGEALAKAHNAIGDLHQGKEKFDRAIEHFKKADAAAKNVSDRAYAKISMVFCYASKGDHENLKKAAQDVIDLKDAPEEYVKMAKDMLKRA